MVTLGGAGGDQVFGNSGTLNLVATDTGSDSISLYTGASTITGGSGQLLIFGGGGTLNFVDGSGSATVNASTGNSTLTAGSGSDLFVFTKTGASPTEMINNFNAGTSVFLNGYAASEVNNDLANAKVIGGSLTVTLSDNTQITFANLTNTAQLGGRFT
jgi:Ca2+-binding RTX toxin-like protein